MKHIGFTGTRHGLETMQYESLGLLMDEIMAQACRDGDGVGVHHGDCIGADEQFHKLAREIGYAVAIHPSTHPLRAHCQGDKMHEPKATLARNADIVAASEIMLACPYEFEEQPRGGTWTTIRMARKAGKPLAIVLPDGTVQRERWV